MITKAEIHVNKISGIYDEINRLYDELVAYETHLEEISIDTSYDRSINERIYIFDDDSVLEWNEFKENVGYSTRKDLNYLDDPS